MTAAPIEIASDLQHRVCDSVDEHVDDVLGLLTTLIGHRTPSQDPDDPTFVREILRCHAFLEHTLDDWGLSQQTWFAKPMTFAEHPVRVATWQGTGGGRSIALNGHVDVVPTGDTSQWQHDPWAGAVKDGKVWGRGACDMKGGVAAMLMAVRTLQLCGVRLKGDVHLHIVSDEEVVGFGTRECVEKAPTPDFVLSTEPTGLNIQPVAGGLEHLRIEFEGVEEHAGRRFASIYPQQQQQGHGVSAIDKAIKIVNALAELEKQWSLSKRHPLLPPGFSTLLPGVIMGGPGGGKEGRLNLISNPGTTPNYCSVEYNVWFYPGENTEQVRKQIEDYVNDIARHDPWLRDHPPKFTWALRNISFPAVDTDPDHPLVRQLELINQDLGRPSQVTGFTAAADLAWYSQQGIPGVIYGPGDIAQAHSPDEFVPVEDMVTATKAIALMMIAWCGLEG